MRTYARLAACHAMAGFCFLLFATSVTFAQTTAFTYQGKLTDAGNPANGNYDLQFRLFDALVSGNQVGATIVREDVAAANGVFTTMLDFGAAAFNGANRFLEIAVRPGASTGAYTTLAPLQPITATPYALMSLNASTANNLSANCVLCVTDAQISALAGSKITGTVANATNATNATNAVNAATATTATNFSGTLAGDVTGTQGATTVARLRSLPLPAPVQADNGKVLRYKNDGINPASFELAADANSGGTITGVTAGTGLSGGGMSGTVNIGIATNGVGATELANNAVTAAKIAAGQVVKSLNGLTDNVTLAAGSNITITPVGNTLTIAASTSNAILNQTALQEGANFNISGTGAAGVIMPGVIGHRSNSGNVESEMS